MKKSKNNAHNILNIKAIIDNATIGAKVGWIWEKDAVFAGVSAVGS